MLYNDGQRSKIPVTPFSTGAKHKPILDETGFEQLLAAAFVLQQHNDTLRATDPTADPLAVLSKLAVADHGRSEPRLPPVSRTPTLQEMLAADEAVRCRACGRQYGAGEEFCGSCGQPRLAAEKSEDLQSKWASLWYMQRAQAGAVSEPDNSGDDHPPELAQPPFLADKEQPRRENELSHEEKELAGKEADKEGKEKKAEDTPVIHSSPFLDAVVPAREELVPAEKDELLASPLQDQSPSNVEEDAVKRHLWEMAQIPHTEEPPETHASVIERHPEPIEDRESDSREYSAIPFHESLAEPMEETPLPEKDQETDTGLGRYFRGPASWTNVAKQRMAMLALGGTAVLLGLVLWSATPASAGGQATWVQEWLVRLGVKNAAPQVQTYTGNPNLRVWVDVHTGLYYCPGSDLYGKTPGGHFRKQRAAQKDEFLPSTNVACE